LVPHLQQWLSWQQAMRRVHSLQYHMKQSTLTHQPSSKFNQLFFYSYTCLYLCLDYWKGLLQVFCDSKCNCYCLWFSCSVSSSRESTLAISSCLGFGNYAAHWALYQTLVLQAIVHLHYDFRNWRIQERILTGIFLVVIAVSFVASSRYSPCCSFQAFRRPWRLLRWERMGILVQVGYLSAAKSPSTATK